MTCARRRLAALSLGDDVEHLCVRTECGSRLVGRGGESSEQAYSLQVGQREQLLEDTAAFRERPSGGVAAHHLAAWEVMRCQAQAINDTRVSAAPLFRCLLGPCRLHRLLPQEPVFA